MLPYTNAQKFQTIQLKSSTDRHTLQLRDQSPKVAVNASNVIPRKSSGVEGAGTGVKSGGRLNIKQKKLKGSSLKRSPSSKKVVSGAHTDV